MHLTNEYNYTTINKWNFMIVIIDNSAFIQNSFFYPHVDQYTYQATLTPQATSSLTPTPKPARLSAVLKEILLQQIA